MKIKVCGMKVENNIMDVATLPPDYMGFIFYEKSSRYFNAEIPELPESIKKIGVFVNAKIDFIVDKIEKHNLQGVQLHGDESPGFCESLRPVVVSNLLLRSNVQHKSDSGRFKNSSNDSNSSGPMPPLKK